MSPSPPWTRRSAVALLTAPAGIAAVIAAACADPAAPVRARAPQRDFFEFCHEHPEIGCPPIPPCAATGNCRCDEIPPPFNLNCNSWIMPGIDTTRRVRIVRADGPNPEKSFTTRNGENTLTLAAEVTPASVGASGLTWTVRDDAGDRVTSAPPAGPLPTGASIAVTVPRQAPERWRSVAHGAGLDQKALAFTVVAEVPGGNGAAAMRDSVVVRQREVDVLRQEYVDFEIPTPSAGEVRTAASVAGLTRFSWSQLNQGDYTYAVLTPRLLQKIPELESMAGYALTLNSVFRNPVHQRFHTPGAVAKLSQHQYGTAVDLATYNKLDTWNRLRDIAKRAGACAEPLAISKVHHVHADWRPSAPVCPKGW